MNLNERSDLSHFGKTFQENMCQLILFDRAFADQTREVLNIDFLEFKYLQVFVKRIFDYKLKYNRHPSTDAMTTIVRTQLGNENELIQKQVRDFFARMLKTEVQDSEYIKDTTIDFCKKQVLKTVIIKSIPLLKNSSFEEIQTLFNDAMKLGSDNDCGYDYIEDFEKRFEIQARNPAPTGWKIIDNLIGGGLGCKELGVVIAPTGAGKSMALVHIGASALKQGKTVIHYTLELADVVVGTRYDSCLTEIPLSNLFSHKDEVLEIIKKVPGRLIIKEYPTRLASPSTIRTHLERLYRQNIPVDMIIIDYGDLLSIKSKNNEKRHELEAIYEELRSIAQEYEVPVWTASQTNRSGLNAAVITMEAISEAFNKCFVADFIFTITRTNDDKNTNGGRIFIAKNRNGPDGLVFPIFMDTRNVKIKVLPATGETISDITEKQTKRQEEVLRDKYKIFRQNQKQKSE